MSRFNDDKKANIGFKYEDTEYFTSMDTYYKGKYIELPDGRLLRVRTWLLSYPPQINGVQLVKGSPENRANSVKAEFNNPQPVLTPEPVVDTRPSIGFSFEGQSYTTSIDAYPSKNIQLPDGRLLGVRGWLESYPPQVSGPYLIEDNDANRANSVKAEFNGPNPALVNDQFSEVFRKMDEINSILGIQNSSTSVDERLSEISRRMAEIRNDSGSDKEPENKSNAKLK